MKRLAYVLLLVATACGAVAADSPQAPILQIRKVVEAPSDGSSERMPVYGSPVGRVLNVEKEVLFDQRALKAAVVNKNREHVCIGITFTQEGRERFAAYTRDNIDTQLATVIDGRLLHRVALVARRGPAREQVREVAFARHARAARDEMRELAEEFQSLVEQASIVTPNIDLLRGYVD